LQALDAAWRTNAGIGAFGAAQRWVACCTQLVESGWPLIGDKKRWRLGELTIEWAAVAPLLGWALFDQTNCGDSKAIW
jgi:hypothetical protein